MDESMVRLVDSLLEMLSERADSGKYDRLGDLCLF